MKAEVVGRCVEVVEVEDEDEDEIIKGCFAIVVKPACGAVARGAVACVHMDFKGRREDKGWLRGFVMGAINDFFV